MKLKKELSKLSNRELMETVSEVLEEKEFNHMIYIQEDNGDKLRHGFVGHSRTKGMKTIVGMTQALYRNIYEIE